VSCFFPFLVGFDYFGGHGIGGFCWRWSLGLPGIGSLDNVQPLTPERQH
jgi:hypothetical protein